MRGLTPHVLLSALLALSASGYPLAPAQVGTWSVTAGGSPTGGFTLLANGSFTGWFSTGGGSTAAYFGEYISISCGIQADGNLSLVEYGWYHMVGDPDPDSALVECMYNVVVDAPRASVHRTSVGTNSLFSMSDLQRGLLPGVCPSTLAEAQLGVPWMPNHWIAAARDATCVSGCGSFSCGVLRCACQCYVLVSDAPLANGGLPAGANFDMVAGAIRFSLDSTYRNLTGVAQRAACQAEAPCSKVLSQGRSSQALQLQPACQAELSE